VPDLVGKSYLDALTALHNAKLNVGHITRKAVNKNDPEAVLEQNPKPGAEVKKGAKVNIMVNEGNVARVKVPTLANQRLETIRDQIGGSNLKLGTVTWVMSDSVQTGVVINQDPSADKDVRPGTEVNVRVSIGSQTSHEEVKQRTVTFKTPDTAGLQDIRVLVKDDTGAYVAYESTHAQGEVVTVSVTCMGRGEYEVYSSDRLITHGQI
jgi:serine/threonine-protein kinase